MKQRIFISLILLLTILFLPFWAYVPLGVIAVVIVPFYWEAVAFGFLIDVLYGAGGGLHAAAALAALVIVAILIPLRERVRWHHF